MISQLRYKRPHGQQGPFAQEHLERRSALVCVRSSTEPASDARPACCSLTLASGLVARRRASSSLNLGIMEDSHLLPNVGASATLSVWNEEDESNASWAEQIPSVIPDDDTFDGVEKALEGDQGFLSMAPANHADFSQEVEFFTSAQGGQATWQDGISNQSESQFVEINARKLSRKRCVRVKIDRDMLSNHFHLSLDEAAASLVCACISVVWSIVTLCCQGIGKSTMKYVCRRLGVEKWPYTTKGQKRKEQAWEGGQK
eukprot:747802-Hanusia_phi.AAC.3